MSLFVGRDVKAQRYQRPAVVKGRADGLLEIEDCEPAALHAVIQYVYWDDYNEEECTGSSDAAIHLLLHAQVDRAAQRFLLPGLGAHTPKRFKTAVSEWRDICTLRDSLKAVATYVYSEDKNEVSLTVRLAVVTALRHVAIKLHRQGYMEDADLATLGDSSPLAQELLLNITALYCIEDWLTNWICPKCNINFYTQSLEDYPIPHCTGCGRKAGVYKAGKIKNSTILEPKCEDAVQYGGLGDRV